MEEIIKDLKEHLGLTELEAKLYLRLVDKGGSSCKEMASSLDNSLEGVYSSVDSLMRRGMVIRAPTKNERYEALHPRMALSNVFKTIEADLLRKIKEKRMMVDRLAAAMIPIYEKGREQEMRKS